MILVGGFLGAGKTTLLARASSSLLQQGKRVGLITNDQAADLVDTALLRQANLDVQEIAGGCFCCRFGQFVDTAQQLVRTMSPDIIIGEPVGSCTDISATVLQPIKDLYADAFRLAPFSVLVDPRRLWDVLDPRRQSAMHASALYILRKQLEEADLIVISKNDLLSTSEQQELMVATLAKFPDKHVHTISSLTGNGLPEWLDVVMSDQYAGTHIVDVDYDIYAEGEAVLGWLNTSLTVMATTATLDWRSFAFAVLDRMRQAANDRNAQIAHVKLSITAATGQYVANLTSSTGDPVLHGHIAGSPKVVNLVVNARVEMPPEDLQAIVEAVLKSTAAEFLTSSQVNAMRSLSPGRPVPTHRYAAVVQAIA
jgi:G3E family GTPase